MTTFCAPAPNPLSSPIPTDTVRLAAQGWTVSNLEDVTRADLQPLVDLGFTAMTAHLTVPAAQVPVETARRAMGVMTDLGLEFLQLWGRYPGMLMEDPSERACGIAGACDLVRLAAAMGAPAAGIRPTSLNPDGAWRWHAAHYTQPVEDRFTEALTTIAACAEEHGIFLVLEAHAVSVLDSPARIVRILKQIPRGKVLVNLDPVNFIADYRSAANSTPVIHTLFDLLGPHAATVHIKDYTLEPRHVIHVAEVMPCTGLLDMDTVLRRTAALSVPAVIEHLPRPQIPEGYRRVAERIAALGLKVA